MTMTTTTTTTTTTNSSNMPRKERKQGKKHHVRARDSKGCFLLRIPQEPEPSEPPPTSPSASTSQLMMTPQQQQLLAAHVTTPTTGQAKGAVPVHMNALSPSSKTSVTSLQLAYLTKMDRANGVNT